MKILNRLPIYDAPTLIDRPSSYGAVGPFGREANRPRANRRVVKKMQTPSFDAFRVRLVKTDDPLVCDVMELHKRYARVRVSPTTYNGRYLGGMSIEGAYLYPLPTISLVN